MLKSNQILLDRYSDMPFLIIRQIAKQHQKFDHAWNHNSHHPNMTNITMSRQKEEFSQQFTISYLAQQIVKMSSNLKRMQTV